MTRAVSNGGTSWAAFAMLSVLLVAGCTGGGADDGHRADDGWDDPAVPRPTGERCESAGAADVGVFRQTNPAEVRAFETWLGCPIDVAIDYSARDTWEHIAEPTYLLDAWAGQPRRLVLGVAMLPELDPTASIEDGATGVYDHYFRSLGQNLVAAGRGTSVLRVGWEFNLTPSRWFTHDREAFKAYWRRIALALDVPGSDFVLDWNPNNGAAGVDAVDFYPGDDVVDVIGVDAYDVSGHAYPYAERCDDSCREATQARAWDTHIFGGVRGLEFWSDFAREHRKPLSLPEWGLWERPDGTGGGDNPLYIRRMYEFITNPSNRVLYQAYFEFDGDDGKHRLMTTFEQSGVVFRELFTGDEE